MQNYFYRDTKSLEIGPLTLDALAKLRFAGVLDGDTPVRVADSSEWKPCREIIADPSHPLPSQTSPAPAAKSPLSPVLMVLIIASALVYGGITLYKSIAAETTLAYGFSVDGKDLSALQLPEVQVDGQSFTSGNHLKPGRHQISVNLKNVEPYKRHFWVIYGDKNLGTLPLESSKGSVVLSADSSDSEFELSGNGLHWQGKLPTQVHDVRVGNYSLTVVRKGWEFKSQITVGRNAITTNKTEFAYGSIEVTSEPTGMAILTNGVEIGKTPMTLQELIPGQYTLIVSDGENDLMADVSIAPKEAAKHVFAFRYGTVQLSSTPTGATVIRKGKEIGKTPLTLNHMPAGKTMVELRLQGYVSTNFPMQAVEGVTENFSAKLISELYVADLSNARQAASTSPPDYHRALESINQALQISPDDVESLQLQKDYKYELALNEASQAFSSNDLDTALAKIDAALIFKPANSNAFDLKGKITAAKAQRDKLAAAEAEQLSAERRAVAGREFDRVVAGVVRQENGRFLIAQTVVSEVWEWRISTTPLKASMALLRSIELCTPKWRVATENHPASDVAVIYLQPRGLSTGNLLVQICQLPNNTVDVRAKMVMGVLQDQNQASYTQSMAEAQARRFEDFTMQYSSALEAVSSKPVAEPVATTLAQMPEPALVEKIKLRGIAGPADKRIAIIGNHTFAKGDWGTIKIDGQSVVIRCLEMTASSVTISIEGVDGTRTLEVDSNKNNSAQNINPTPEQSGSLNETPETSVPTMPIAGVPSTANTMNKISDAQVEMFCESLEDVDPGKVIHALKKLREMKATEAAPRILPCLTHSNPDVIREACRTLTVIGNKDAIPAIEPLLTNARPDIVREACRTLAVIGNKDAIPAIEPLLTNARPDLVREACRTLAVIGNKDTIPAIEPLLTNSRSDIKKDAQNAITQLQAKP